MRVPGEDEELRWMLIAHGSDLLSKFTDREMQIVEMRYGLTGARPHTTEEVAKAFGISRERIRQIEMRILRKLRNSDL